MDSFLKVSEKHYLASIYISTEKVSTEKIFGFSDKLSRKGYKLRVSEELKEAKFRTEALKQKSFLKFSQQVFCTCFLVGILSEDTRRILQLHLSSFWKTQKEQS